MQSRNKFPDNHLIKSVENLSYVYFFKTGILKNFSLVFSHEYYKMFKGNVFIENLHWLLFSVA